MFEQKKELQQAQLYNGTIEGIIYFTREKSYFKRNSWIQLDIVFQTNYYSIGAISKLSEENNPQNFSNELTIKRICS